MQGINWNICKTLEYLLRWNRSKNQSSNTKFHAHYGAIRWKSHFSKKTIVLFTVAQCMQMYTNHNQFYIIFSFVSFLLIIRTDFFPFVFSLKPFQKCHFQQIWPYSFCVTSLHVLETDKVFVCCCFFLIWLQLHKICLKCMLIEWDVTAFEKYSICILWSFDHFFIDMKF